MSQLISRLAAVCREHLLREKILVVPSLAIGHQIADAVAHGGTPWVNLRVETMRTLTDAVAGFAFASEGVTVLSRAQALALIERACDRVLDSLSYFAALAGRPGLHRAIQRSIDDLRHAGLRPDALPAGAFEDERKARDLAAIIGAYEEELRERQYIDRYGVLARAIQLAESRDAIWIVVDELELSNAEERLLRAVAGEVERMSPAETRTAAQDVRFVRAIGEENELRGALRSILRDAISFDAAEVIYTARDPYLALAYELTSEYAIPTTFAEGIAAPFTRPGQAALGFLQWLGSDYETLPLQRIARAGAIRTDGESLTPFTFGRILRRAMIGWGRDRYVPRLEAFIAGLESDLEETDFESRIAGIQREIVRARETLILIQALLDAAAPLGGDLLDAPSLARSVLAFLDRFAATRNEIDGMALAALRRMLTELARLPEASVPRRMAIDRLADAIAAIHVAASNPRPGHLHVAPVRAGGWSGRRTIFVVGLDDSRHPGAGLQDPIVLDAERTAINTAIDPRRLDLQGESPMRNSARLRRLFARAPDARWTLSFTEMDLRERRARFPSRDVLEVYRSVSGQSGATYEQLITAATPAGFLEADVPLSAGEWWLGERFVRGRLDLRPEIMAAYSWLARGEEARLARASDAITAWDGRIDVPPEAIDPRLTGRVYSASQMERAARCPFGWFAERVLGIEAVDELQRVEDQWLENRQFGTLVHEVLETFMDEFCIAGEKLSLTAHLDRLEQIAKGSLEEWRAEVPPGTETAYARQRDELLEACAIFLRAEERLCDRITPRYFEAPFGAADDSPIGMAEPLSIPLGGGRQIRLRGRIDRVDQDVTTGGWEVWDYKTGSLFEFRDAWRLNRGTKLQHAIYARALAEMLRARGIPGKVQCSGYYFPTAKGGGERVIRECAPGELENTLNLLCDVIGSGFFPLPDEGRCSFCAFPELCGSKEEGAERMARKQMANADNPGVAAWRRLQDVD